MTSLVVLSRSLSRSLFGSSVNMEGMGFTSYMLYIVWRLDSVSVWLQRLCGLYSGSETTFHPFGIFYLLKDSLNILLQCIARRAWCLIYDECGGCIHWIQCFDYLSCWSWWRTLRFSVHLPWWMWNNDLKFLISSLIYKIL